MRILLVTPGFPPFPGGGERYAGSLALHLLRRECRVTVLTSTARTERDFWQPDNLARIFRDDQESGLHVLRCALHNMPGGRSGLLIWRKAMVLLSALPGDQSAVLLAMARNIPPISSLTQAFAQLPDAYDVIHAFNVSWEYPMAEAWQFARRHRRPLVITPFAHLGTGGHDRVARNSTMDHQMRILQEASAVLTLTNMERAGLIKRGVAGERVVMVGSGLDTLPTLMNEKDLLQQYHLTSPFIVFVGRASHDKGASHAAESIRLLRREGIAVPLVLIGQSTPEFERFYRNLDAADRQLIRPLGLLSDAQKHTLLQAASLLVLPSRTDSFGIVLLEAWAHGKPVIGARAGGIPGVIDDGQDGLLVDFGDVAGLARAIKRLLSDNTLRATMGQCGQAKLSTDYSWKQVTDRVMNIYQQVI